MNEKLKAIAEKAGADLVALVIEGEQKILDAWSEAEQSAQDNETAPKFKLAFSVSLDLDKDAMTTELAWNVKHKLSTACQIPDPNQPELEGVTIEAGGKTVKLTDKDLRKMVAVNKN